MGLLEQVEIAPLPPERYESVITPERAQDVREAIETAHTVFADRAIWNVNSTSAGGGVAEMLQSLLAYARGADVDARWTVIKGNSDFFEITKRIHNHLHSFAGDGGQLGDAEHEKYDAALKPNIDEFLKLVSQRDIALLHDPQTAGMIPALKAAGIPVVWRCHVGIDTPDDLARNAWAFLRPYVIQADAYVFSRKTFVWEGSRRLQNLPDRTFDRRLLTQEPRDGRRQRGGHPGQDRPGRGRRLEAGLPPPGRESSGDQARRRGPHHGPARRRHPPGDPGVALGRAEGSAGRDSGFRGPRRPGHRRPPDVRRPHDRRRLRRPRGP